MFLASLLDRALDGRSAIAPRRASRYEADLGEAEPAWIETAAEAPTLGAPRREDPLARPQGLPPVETRADDPPEPVSGRREATPPAPIAPSALRPAEPDAAVTIIRQLEQLAPPAPSEPAPITPSPAAPSPGPAPPEVRTHERVEIRHEPREIERRLEVLTREHRVEQVAREAAPSPAAAAAAEPIRPRPNPTVPPAAPLAGPRDLAPPVTAAVSPPPATTIVQVTIGRVEVRGAPAPAPRPAASPRAPRVGLDDYLRRREQA